MLNVCVLPSRRPSYAEFIQSRRCRFRHLGISKKEDGGTFCILGNEIYSHLLHWKK